MQGQSERRVIWDGSIDWQEKNPVMQTPYPHVMRTYNCKMLGLMAADGSGRCQVNAHNWPKKLTMRLIPKQLLATSMSTYLKNSRNVVCELASEASGLDVLRETMKAGYACCVHLPSTSRGDVRLMILMYSAERKMFIGVIPDDQERVIVALRLAIVRYKLAGTQNPGASQHHQAMFGGSVVNLAQKHPGTGIDGSHSTAGPGNVTAQQGGNPVAKPRLQMSEEERSRCLFKLHQLAKILETAKQTATQNHRMATDGASTSMSSNASVPLGVVANSSSSLQNNGSPTNKRNRDSIGHLPAAKVPKISKQTASIIDETFSCIVCQGPMRHPVFTNCCNSLVACKQCSVEWAAKSDTCVKCRALNPVYTELLGMHEGIGALKDSGFFE